MSKEKHTDDNAPGDIMSHSRQIAERLQRLVHSKAYVLQRQKMLEMLHVPEHPITVADVGCGEGAFCRDIRGILPLNSRIIGVDVSPFVLNLAKAQEAADDMSPVSYMLSDAKKLPFVSESFDLVVFANTLKYLGTESSELEALQEHLRVLRPGGQLLVVDSNDGEIVFRGADPDLTSRIVNEYAHLQGDPRSGERIAGFCELLGLQGLTQQIIALRETEFTEQQAGFAMAYNMQNVLSTCETLPPGELSSFCDQLSQAAQMESYGWEYTKYAVIGQKPQ